MTACLLLVFSCILFLSILCYFSCSAVAGFFLRCHTEPTTTLELTATRVTHVRFVRSEGGVSGGFALLVCAGCLTGSHVELWQLDTREVPLHRFYQPADAATPLTVQVGFMCCSCSLHCAS